MKIRHYLPVAVLGLCCALFMSATPPSPTFQNPVIIHTSKGVNPFPHPIRERGVTLHISPYYQSANGAKNDNGQKVPLGDRLGRWSMIGLIQGVNAAPGAAGNGTLPSQFATLEAARSGLSGLGFTDGTFTGSNVLGYYSVPVGYEQFGGRAQLDLNFVRGLGATVRFGFGRYKQEPTFNDLTCTATICNNCNDPCFRRIEVNAVKKLLTDPGKRDKIADEIGLSLNNLSGTCFEDVHVDLHWTSAFRMNDAEDELAVHVVPFFALGAWIPSGCRKNENLAFSLASGSNGVWGITAEAMLNFAFPKSVEFGVGIAGAFFGSETRDFRMPSSLNQYNIYPWKVRAKRGAGATWQVHVDFMMHHFLDKLSFYFNYIYTKKEKDEFTLLEPSRNALFFPGKRERESGWASQKWHAGFDYDITPDLNLGIAVQPTITGERVYKNTTIIGSLQFRWR